MFFGLDIPTHIVLSSTYTYQPFNRLTGAAGSSFTYDAKGNLTHKEWTVSSGPAAGQYTTDLTYDFENRLTLASVRWISANDDVTTNVS